MKYKIIYLIVISFNCKSLINGSKVGHDCKHIPPSPHQVFHVFHLFFIFINHLIINSFIYN